MTCTVSGKVTVYVTGVVRNNDSTHTHLFQVIIAIGAGTAMVSDSIRVPAAIPEDATTHEGRSAFAIVCAIDKAPVTPATFPLATPEVIAIEVLADTNGVLQIILDSIQCSWEERYN
jgi:hypothetical protein